MTKRTKRSKQDQRSQGRPENARRKGDLRPEFAAPLVNRQETHPQFRRRSTLQRNDGRLHSLTQTSKRRRGRSHPGNRLRKVASGALVGHRVGHARSLRLETAAAVNKAFSEIDPQVRIAFALMKDHGVLKALGLVSLYESRMRRLHERARRDLDRLQTARTPKETKIPRFTQLAPISGNRPARANLFPLIDFQGRTRPPGPRKK